MAGWKQIFKLLNSIRKESTSALDKFNAAQKHLLNVGKGDPDADELRDALVGSPLKKGDPVTQETSEQCKQSCQAQSQIRGMVAGNDFCKGVEANIEKALA